MILENGTRVQITKISEKDYDFLDGEFEQLSNLVNEQEGVILYHNEASPEFGERESYQVLVTCKDGSKRELEIELDEFITI